MFAPRQEAEPRPAVLVVPLGPYTAPFSELVWALYRQRNLAVVEAWVVVDRRGMEYVESDLLASGSAIDQLRTVLGPHVLGHDDVHLRIVRRETGEVVADDRERRDAERTKQTIWNAARDAIHTAGDRTVVFGLTEGTRRTSCALLSAFFQLLGRSQDLLVDVRVEDARVDGDVPFLFPEQPQRHIRHEHSVIDARRVEISLVEVEVPRLFGVLDGQLLTTLDSVQRVSKARERSAPPPVVINLEAGSVKVDGQLVELSTAERFWYAYLAFRRGETTDGWVLAGQSGHADFYAFLQRVGAERFAASIRTKPLRRLIEGEFVHDEDLRNLRGKTVQRMKRWCAAHRPELGPLLIPEPDGNGRQRLPIPAHRIRLIGI